MISTLADLSEFNNAVFPYDFSCHNDSLFLTVTEDNMSIFINVFRNQYHFFVVSYSSLKNIHS